MKYERATHDTTIDHTPRHVADAMRRLQRVPITCAEAACLARATRISADARTICGDHYRAERLERRIAQQREDRAAMRRR